MQTRISAIRILPRWIIVLIDLGFILASIVLAYLLRFNFDLNPIASRNIFSEIFFYLATHLIVIMVLKPYRGIIRYTGPQDAIRVVRAMLISFMLLLGVNEIYNLTYGLRVIPFSVLSIAFFISVFTLVSYRILVKALFSYYSASVKKQVSILIFGAGKLGQLTRQIIESDSYSNMKVLAFVDDDRQKAGNQIGSTPIIGLTDISKFAAYPRMELIIALRDISPMRKNEVVDACSIFKIKVRQVPSFDSWVKGELSVRQIRDVSIEDLLGRETISINNIKIGHELEDKRIFVTGAAGSIGSELVRQISQYNPSLMVLIDQSETGIFDLECEIESNTTKIQYQFVVADITNPQRIEQLFLKYHPDVIFHAAAYKHVPIMEKNPSEAILCNVLGTKYLADLSFKFMVKKFVMISTDKAVNPTNVMGASKRIAEMYVQSLNNFKVANKEYYTKFVTTRFGNVLGSNGSVIPLFKKQIDKGGPITVTHPDITRYFMTISEAVELVLEAASMGEGGEIYLFDMGESVKIVDLAKRMIHLSGLELNKDIEIHFTGLREGEKLYEELLNNKENTISTYHEKIMIAKVVEYAYMSISREIDKLIDLAKEKDEFEVVTQMKKMVPEYLSSFSRYEILDKQGETGKAV